MHEEMSFAAPSSRLESAPELSMAELRDKLRDPEYLPTHQDIDRLFGTNSNFSEAWQSFCYDPENPVFEFLNQEFIDSLSDYLGQRIADLKTSENLPTIILEIGAGNGRLSHFLQEKLNKKTANGVRVIATDSGDWDLHAEFPVEKIDHAAAIEKYHPRIVIASWIPRGVDFTDDLRASKNLEEYLLIGEPDDGCCGDKWRTWGYAGAMSEKIPPYAADGFERQDLDEISAHQICRTDKPGEHYRSQTVSFKRRA